MADIIVLVKEMEIKRLRGLQKGKSKAKRGWSVQVRTSRAKESVGLNRGKGDGRTVRMVVRWWGGRAVKQNDDTPWRPLKGRGGDGGGRRGVKQEMG